MYASALTGLNLIIRSVTEGVQSSLLRARSIARAVQALPRYPCVCEIRAISLAAFLHVCKGALIGHSALGTYPSIGRRLRVTSTLLCFRRILSRATIHLQGFELCIHLLHIRRKKVLELAGGIFRGKQEIPSGLSKLSPLSTAGETSDLSSSR